MKYVAYDDKVFDTQKACEAYEQSREGLTSLVSRYGRVITVTMRANFTRNVILLTTSPSEEADRACVEQIFGSMYSFDDAGEVVTNWRITKVGKPDSKAVRLAVNAMSMKMHRGWADITDGGEFEDYLYNALPNSVFSSETSFDKANVHWAYFKFGTLEWGFRHDGEGNDYEGVD